MSIKSRSLNGITPRAILALATVSIVFATSALSLFAARKNGRIAFIKVPDVYIMDADGGNVRQLTSFGPYKSATLPSWAPNDEELVFTVTPADSPAELWIMNSDGTHQRLLAGDRIYSNTAASFSPDGHSVIFARCLAQRLLPTDGCAIFRIQADGTGLAAITNIRRAASDFNPIFSPDGKTLAFESYNREGIRGAIYLMDADGSNVRRLTPPSLGATTPSWSPDGLKIAFSSHCCTGQNSDIWVIGHDGRGLSRIADSCVGDCDDWEYLNSFPSWSPDGGAIAFGEAMGTPARGIWVVDAKTAGFSDRSFSTLIRPGGIQPRWSHAP